MVIGLGGRERRPRETEFHITAASEVMAILALASDLQDLRARLGRIVIATRTRRRAGDAEELKVAGAMAVLMREAMKPNLVQTIEGGPAFIHCGPFANIAHGNSSVVADRIALKLVEIVVTEAGFGADMGFQKFIDIKCRVSGLRPAAAVIVATVRALKMHGGVGQVVAGKPLDPALLEEDADGVRRGCANLAQHIDIVRAVRLPAVVAINAFPTDKPSEIAVVQRVALAAGARDAVVATTSPTAAQAQRIWRGPSGRQPRSGAPEFQFLYPEDATLATDRGIATRVYGADGVDFSRRQARSSQFETPATATCRCAWPRPVVAQPRAEPEGPADRLPRADPRRRLSAGAGFVTPLCGEMRTMPGLPSHPGGENIDIDADGNIVGLF